MDNKLKAVFSNEKVRFGGKINFENQEARVNFQKALGTVWEEGKCIKAEGVRSIETLVCEGEHTYTLKNNDNIRFLMVGPSCETISHTFDIRGKQKELKFRKYFTKSAMILETPEESVVYLKLTMETKTRKMGIIYEPHLNQAENIRGVAESYTIAVAFFDRFFLKVIKDNKNSISDTETTSILNLYNLLRELASIYNKIYYVEQIFSINFNPVELTPNEESELDLEELYLTLKEDKVIRINEKIAELTSEGVVMKQDSETEIEVGMMLDVTFIGNVTYLLWGKKIVLYTANLVTNAIVKDIEMMQNNTVRVVYGDEDSKPMYISYKGFRTEEEAKKEAERILDHKEAYVQAMTVLEYLNDAGSVATEEGN